VSSKKSAKAAKKIFQFIHEILTVLAGVDEYQNIALFMFLEAAKAADSYDVKFESIAYEFVTKAFTLYEDTADSALRVRLCVLVVGCWLCGLELIFFFFLSCLFSHFPPPLSFYNRSGPCSPASHWYAPNMCQFFG
jgi:hypothetical protein